MKASIIASPRALTHGISLLTLAVILNLLRPYPRFIPESLAFHLGGRLFDFMVIALCVISLAWRRQVLLPVPVRRPMAALLVIFLFHALLLLTWGVAVRGYALGVRDLYEPLRLLIVALVMVAALNDHRLGDPRFWRRFWIGAILLFAVVVVIRVTQPPLLFTLTDLFMGASKDKFVLERAIVRQTGFFVNPNWAGVFLTWGLAYFLFHFSWRRPSAYFFVLLTGLLIVVTGSRTALVSTAVVVGFWLLRGAKLAQWAVGLGAAAVLIGAMIWNLEGLLSILPSHQRELVRAVAEGRSMTDVSSLSVRVEVWKVAMEGQFWKAPLLGHGSFKSSVVDVVDNQYIKWLVWYGVAGVAMLLAFYVYFPLLALTAVRRSGPAERQFADSVLASLVAVLVASIAGAMFDVTQLGFLLAMMYGAALNMGWRAGGLSSAHGLGPNRPRHAGKPA